MEKQLLSAVGKIAGIGGIALGVFLLIFQDVLKKQFLQDIGLSHTQAFAIIFSLLILTFGISGIGILAWLLGKSIDPKTPLPTLGLGALAGLVALVLVVTVYVGAKAFSQPPDPMPAPPDQKEEAKCVDAPAQYPAMDATRVVAFTYYAEDPGGPGNRYWTFEQPDRWAEKSDIGDNYFSVDKRGHVGVCDGTIISRLGDIFQMFISDKNCPTKQLYFRRPPQCGWIGFAQMQNAR